MDIDRDTWIIFGVLALFLVVAVYLYSNHPPSTASMQAVKTTTTLITGSCVNPKGPATSQMCYNSRVYTCNCVKTKCGWAPTGQNCYNIL